MQRCRQVAASRRRDLQTKLSLMKQTNAGEYRVVVENGKWIKKLDAMLWNVVRVYVAVAVGVALLRRAACPCSTAVLFCVVSRATAAASITVQRVLLVQLGWRTPATQVQSRPVTDELNAARIALFLLHVEWLCDNVKRRHSNAATAAAVAAAGGGPLVVDAPPFSRSLLFIVV